MLRTELNEFIKPTQMLIGKFNEMKKIPDTEWVTLENEYTKAMELRRRALLHFDKFKAGSDEQKQLAPLIVELQAIETTWLALFKKVDLDEQNKQEIAEIRSQLEREKQAKKIKNLVQSGRSDKDILQELKIEEKSHDHNEVKRVRIEAERFAVRMAVMKLEGPKKEFVDDHAILEYSKNTWWKQANETKISILRIESPFEGFAPLSPLPRIKAITNWIQQGKSDQQILALLSQSDEWKPYVRPRSSFAARLEEPTSQTAPKELSKFTQEIRDELKLTQKPAGSVINSKQYIYIGSDVYQTYRVESTVHKMIVERWHPSANADLLQSLEMRFRLQSHPKVKPRIINMLAIDGTDVYVEEPIMNVEEIIEDARLSNKPLTPYQRLRILLDVAKTFKAYLETGHTMKKTNKHGVALPIFPGAKLNQICVVPSKDSITHWKSAFEDNDLKSDVVLKLYENAEIQTTHIGKSSSMFQNAPIAFLPPEMTADSVKNDQLLQLYYNDRNTFNRMMESYLSYLFGICAFQVWLSVPVEKFTKGDFRRIVVMRLKPKENPELAKIYNEKWMGLPEEDGTPFYDLVQMGCWQLDPSQRPSLSEIVHTMEELCLQALEPINKQAQQLAVQTRPASLATGSVFSNTPSPQQPVADIHDKDKPIQNKRC